MFTLGRVEIGQDYSQATLELRESDDVYEEKILFEKPPAEHSDCSTLGSHLQFHH